MLGCVVVLLLGISALVVLQHDHTPDAEPSPQLGQFRDWGGCLVLYVGGVVALSPFAEIPAVILALLIFSPLFGTFILLVSSAVDRQKRRNG